LALGRHLVLGRQMKLRLGVIPQDEPDPSQTVNPSSRDQAEVMASLHRSVLPAVPEILPETPPHAASRHPTPRSPAAPITWAVVWAREALDGGVNPRRIDGKDGVAGSIPAGGSTPNQQLRPGKYPTCCMLGDP
jgi:hypothetical protein